MDLYMRESHPIPLMILSKRNPVPLLVLLALGLLEAIRVEFEIGDVFFVRVNICLGTVPGIRLVLLEKWHFRKRKRLCAFVV